VTGSKFKTSCGGLDFGIGKGADGTRDTSGRASGVDGLGWRGGIWWEGGMVEGLYGDGGAMEVETASAAGTGGLAACRT